MLKHLQQLEQKIQSKSVPQNPQHQLSHYTRIAESLFETGNVIIAEEFPLNSQRCFSILETILQQNYPIQYQKGLAVAIANYVQICSKFDSIWMLKAFDYLINIVNKKGVSQIGKTIGFEVLYSLLTIRQTLPPISFNILCEISNVMIKYIKGTSEIPLRQSLARFISILIDEGVCSKETIRTDFLKYTLKFCQSDKSEGLRIEGLKALLSFLKKGYYQNIDNLLSVALKSLQQSEESSRAMQLTVESLGYLFHNQVETERQATHLLLQKKQDKKNQPQQLQPLNSKEYLTKLFQGFSEGIRQTNKLISYLQAWEICLLMEITKHGSVTARGSFEVLSVYLQQISDLKQYCDPQVFNQCNRLCTVLLQRLNKPQLQEVLDYLLEKTKKLTNSNGNPVDLGRLLLQGVKVISDCLGTSVLNDKLLRPNQFIDSLGGAVSLSQLDIPPKQINSPLFIDCIQEFQQALKSFFEQNSKWQQNILSILLNISTIYTADLGVGPQDHYQRERTSNLLRGHAICLANLFGSVDTQVHSVPIELASQLWNTARSLIMGHTMFKKENTDKANLRRFQVITVENAFQKETGFLILIELLQRWFMQQQPRLKEILQIIQDAMRALGAKQFADMNEYTMTLIGLGRVPQLLFILMISPLGKMVTENMIKFIAQTLLQIYQYLIKPNLKVDRMNSHLMFCKIYTFRCLKILNPKTYTSQINNLVQLFVDDVLISGSSWEDLSDDYIIQRCIINNNSKDSNDEIQLALSASEFFGSIMITKAFSIKNKINLINFIYTNINTICQSKNFDSRARRLIPYLIIIRSIQNNILQNPTEIPEDEGFIQQLFQSIEACASITNSKPVKILVGIIMTQYFQIQSPYIDKIKILNSLLQPQNLQSSTAYIIAEIFTKTKILQEPNNNDTSYLILQNLFVKLTSHLNTYPEDVLYMISTISHLNLPQVIQLIKGSFMFLAFYLMGTNNTNELQNQSQTLINYFINTKTGLRDPIHANTYLNTIVGNIKFMCLEEAKLIEYIKICFYITKEGNDTIKLYSEQQLLFLNERFQLLPIIDESPSNDFKQILLLLNNELKLQPFPSQNVKLLQKIFTRLFKNVLDKLSTQKQIELLAPYILEEYFENEEKQPDQQQPKKQAIQASGSLMDAQDPDDSENNQTKKKYENHARTRVFLMKWASKILGTYKPLSETPQQLLQTASYLFTFLFKVTTLQNEIIRDEAYTIFAKFFKSLESISETGEALEEGDNSRPLITVFAAQTDAVISETLKREDQNSPQTNISNLKLSAKFFGLIAASDPTLANKLVNNLCRGLLSSQQNKLAPSQFYSEKAVVLIILHRVRALRKVLIHIGNIELYQQYFSIEQLQVIYENVLGLLQDLFIILCCQRPSIKKFSSFKFIYNGSRSSYDSTAFQELLPHILQVWSLLLPFKFETSYNTSEELAVSLICFLLTNQSSLENVRPTDSQVSFQSEQRNTQKILIYHRVLETLLYALPYLSLKVLDGISDLYSHLLVLSDNEQLTSIVSKIFISLTNIMNHAQAHKEQLIECLNYLYQNQNDRTQLKKILDSLLILANLSVESQARIKYLVWDYVKSEQNYQIIQDLIQKLLNINSIQPDYMMLQLLNEIWQNKEPQSEQIKLLAQIYQFINKQELLDAINDYVEENLSKFIHFGTQQMQITKKIDPAFLQIIAPNIGLMCVKLREGQKPDWNKIIDSVKFLLFIYILSPEKEIHFTIIIKSLLLFVDPAFQQKPEIIQISQQALKHVITITDTRIIELCLKQVNDKIKLIVQTIYQQVQNELEAKRLEEEKKKQQASAQQGTIKLKMFGQK